MKPKLKKLKKIFLQSIDLNWKSHIQYLEQLRQVIGLRSYGQRDPLIEYKKEAFELFENLLNKLKLDYVTILMNLRIIEKSKEENNFKINPNNKNQKCLLIIIKVKKYLEMIDVRLQEKNLKLLWSFIKEIGVVKIVKEIPNKIINFFFELIN